MAKLVSRVYGEGLFEAALEQDKLDRIYQEVQEVVSLLKQNESLQKLLNHPQISREEKKKMIESIFLDRVSKEIVGFLILIVQKGRAGEMIKSLDYFVDKVKEYKKIGVAYVASAMELSEEQKDAIRLKLLETTRYILFEIHYMTDPSLMGGLVIRIGDRVIDSSIKHKLNHMSRKLQSLQ